MTPMGRLVAAVSACHCALSLWVASAVPGPLLAADDVAYLTMARTLAGEGASSLGSQPPYGVLYPVVLAPGWIVGLDESAMLAYARVVNSVFGAALVPVLYLLARRLVGAERGWALVGAVIGASLPALVLHGSIAWPERLLPLLLAGAVLALVAAYQRRSAAATATAVALAVAAFAAHPRVAGAALVVVVTAAWCRWRCDDRRSAVAALWAGAIGAVAAEAARRLLSEATFGDLGAYGVRDLSSRRGIAEVPDMVVHGLGATAYLALASAGLAVLGVVVLARRRPLGWVPLALLVAVTVAAAWFLTGVERADAWLYGRYVEVVAPVVVMAGVIGLWRLRWKVAVPLLVVSPVVAGVVAGWAGPGATWERARSPVMMLGVEVSGAPFGSQIFEPAAVASTALVVGLVLWALARTGSPALVLVVALVFGGVGVASGLEKLDQLYDTSISGQVDVALGGLDDVTVAIEPAVQPNAAAAIAWRVGLDRTVPWTDVARATHVVLVAGDAPPAGAVHVAAIDGVDIWAL